MKNYTDQQIKIAVNSTYSMRQTLIQLGLVPKGHNYRTIYNHIERLGLSTVHWKKQGWSKGMKFRTEDKISNEELFIQGRLHSSNSVIRHRVIKHKLLPYACAICRNSAVWQNSALALHLDHINGDPSDNRLCNLRFLCPNCHSQTKTYCRGIN